MKDKKILAVITYSGGGQWTEAAVIGSEMDSFCITDNIFDTNTPKEKVRLKEHIATEKPPAVIFDGYWTPEGKTAITHEQIAFAKEIAVLGVEPFIILNADAQRAECEIWRFFKPLAFKDMKEPVLFLSRLGRHGGEEFETPTGKVSEYSGGDRGDRYRNRALRDGRAFTDRNWPLIKQLVEKELLQK